MKNKKYVAICVTIVALAAVLLTQPLWATSIEDEKKKQNEMESDLQDYQSMLSNLESLRSDMESYIRALDEQLNAITNHLNELNVQMAAKQIEIDETNAVLAEQEEDIARQYEAMKKRIQFMFENGNTYYLDMILGSNSMADFLNKAEYMKEITDYDRNMLNKMKETKAQIELTKATLEAEKQSLADMAAQAEGEKNSVEALVADKQNQLLSTENQINNTQMDIENQQEEIEAQKHLVAELEEIERKRKAEEERKRKEAEQRQQQAQIQNYDGGTFMWPLPGNYRITSPYGDRLDPFTGQTVYHNGIDIGASTGTEIHAAYDGEIAWAYYSTTAGNWIGIDHGDGLYTIYMHASALLVSEGDKVSKGDVIGLVGSTGRSTGPHLHLSIRKNGSYVSPKDYLNY